MHEDSSFITLTYGPDFLPDDLSVNVCHFQSFMKRLRARVAPLRLRFFHCGEYGDELSRPHYHAIIFGFGFPDREFYSSADGVRLYTSKFLDTVWQRGFSTIGDVTFESCAYVARYVTKKVNGEKGLDHYMVLDERTGEVRPITPEYATMSLKPPIGTSWFEEFGTEVVKNDSVVMNGVVMKPPRFYESLYSPLELEAVKGLRDAEARKRDSDNTPRRLRDREVCKEAQINFLKRGYEHEVTSV